MLITLCALAAYLYGALPYAYIATYVLKGKNLAQEGTGNIGVTNAFKVGGMAVGIITVAGEISKAIFPILAAKYLFNGSLYVALLFVYLCFFGTCCSVFLKGRGGKGNTVALWSLMILSPIAGAVLLVLWTAVVIISKNNPKIKPLPIVLLPFIFHAFERDFYFTAFCVLLSLTMFINYRMRLDDYKFYGIFSGKPPKDHDAPGAILKEP